MRARRSMVLTVFLTSLDGTIVRPFPPFANLRFLALAELTSSCAAAQGRHGPPAHRLAVQRAPRRDVGRSRVYAPLV